jgi:hypothetical protein
MCNTREQTDNCMGIAPSTGDYVNFRLTSNSTSNFFAVSTSFFKPNPFCGMPVQHRADHTDVR